MKKNRFSTIALMALCLGALASCVEQPAEKTTYSAEDVVAKVAEAGAIAIWSDSGEPIRNSAKKKSANQSFGALPLILIRSDLATLRGNKAVLDRL